MERYTINVSANVVSLERSTQSTSFLGIFVYNLIQDFTGDESGAVTTHRTPRCICLEPQDFTPSHLSELLRGRQVNESQYIGERISRKVKCLLTNDKSLREPFYVHVHVSFIKERRLFLDASLVFLQRSVEVCNRLVEEQRVVLEEKNEIICSICIEDLSKSHEESIIEMPECLHMFHQNCLLEWLSWKNSCPLCRRVPYDEDQEFDIQSF